MKMFWQLYTAFFRLYRVLCTSSVWEGLVASHMSVCNAFTTKKSYQKFSFSLKTIKIAHSGMSKNAKKLSLSLKMVGRLQSLRMVGKTLNSLHWSVQSIQSETVSACWKAVTDQASASVSNIIEIHFGVWYLPSLYLMAGDEAPIISKNAGFVNCLVLWVFLFPPPP